MFGAAETLFTRCSCFEASAYGVRASVNRRHKKNRKMLTKDNTLKISNRNVTPSVRSRSRSHIYAGAFDSGNLTELQSLSQDAISSSLLFYFDTSVAVSTPHHNWQTRKTARLTQRERERGWKTHTWEMNANNLRALSFTWLFSVCVVEKNKMKKEAAKYSLRFYCGRTSFTVHAECHSTANMTIKQINCESSKKRLQRTQNKTTNWIEYTMVKWWESHTHTRREKEIKSKWVKEKGKKKETDRAKKKKGQKQMNMPFDMRHEAAKKSS